MKITEKIYDITTGEETIVEREATPQEVQERANATAKIEAEQAQAEASATARAAILDRLGITQEEAQLLLGGK
jgi:hypothetical protein